MPPDLNGVSLGYEFGDIEDLAVRSLHCRDICFPEVLLYTVTQTNSLSFGRSRHV